MNLIECRDAEPDELPHNARTLAELAITNGWIVRTTFCRGPFPMKNNADRVVDSLAVRMQRNSDRLVALWIDAKFWRALAPFQVFTLAGIRAQVESRPADRAAAA